MVDGKPLGRAAWRVSVGLVWAPVVAVVSIAVVVAGTMFVNNLRLQSWSNEFLDIPPPARARAVEHGTDFGVLVGNGNHCDRSVWIVLDTILAPSDVEEHYERPFAHAMERERDSPSSTVGSITAEALGPERVRVERFLIGSSAGWDLRCH